MHASQEIHRSINTEREPKPKWNGPRIRRNVVTDGETEQRLTQDSPEGRPAHPEISSYGMIWMILGSIAAVVVLSAIVLAVWGFSAGILVLVFGAALISFGNPVIWAMLFRADERYEIEETPDSSQD